MRLAQWLDSTQDVPRREREILLAELAGISRAQTLIPESAIIDHAQLVSLDEPISRLRAGEPLAYVLGHQDFWDLRLRVSPAVLIPRPETELLVEYALESTPKAGRLLDLGTGSGAVALACAHARPDLQVTAADVCPNALSLARENADDLGLDIALTRSDWFSELSGKFDVVVSNPPYVAEADPHLAQLSHEPVLALTAGPDGLDHIRRIVASAPNHLQPGGHLAIEHGYDQGDACRSEFEAAGLQAVTTAQDLAGLDRMTHGCLPQGET